MRIETDHPPDHIGGWSLFKHEDEPLYQIGAKFTCRMEDCSTKFSQIYSRLATSLLQQVDPSLEVMEFTLGSAREMKRLTERARYRNEWYVSLNCNDTEDRPTIAPEKIAPDDGKPIPLSLAVMKLDKIGRNNSVARINRPKFLTPVSSYIFIADVEERDRKRIKEAEEELGMVKGVLTGQSRYWSPEQLADKFKLHVDGSGIDLSFL